MVDAVLSSGFLAFARHIGFLGALEQRGLPVDGVCGTSSGALIGALWAAGHSAAEIEAQVAPRRPLSLMRPRVLPWRAPGLGVFSITPLVEYLRDLLPPRFSDLQRTLAVGVRGPDGGHELLTDGSLPESVAASCAMPWVFAPVTIGGRRYQDGGAVDRLGLAAWRSLRGDRPVVVHEVERTAGRDVTTDFGDAVVVRTPRSGARFWGYGDFAGQVVEAREIAGAALARLG